MRGRRGRGGMRRADCGLAGRAPGVHGELGPPFSLPLIAWQCTDSLPGRSHGLRHAVPTALLSTQHAVQGISADQSPCPPLRTPPPLAACSLGSSGDPLGFSHHLPADLYCMSPLAQPSPLPSLRCAAGGPQQRWRGWQPREGPGPGSGAGRRHPHLHRPALGALHAAVHRCLGGGTGGGPVLRRLSGR